MATVREIYQYLDGLAPFSLQMEFDNAGFLVGRGERAVSKILVSLDITEEVAEEAAELGAELIVSHHPVIFRPAKSVTDGDPDGRVLLALAEHRIAAICAHTNLDAVAGGVNDALAQKLGLVQIEQLHQDGVDGSGRPYGIGRVAVGGGACADLLRDALALGCDTFVTADVKYNGFLDAKALGVNLIDAGHYPTEQVVCPVLAKWLAAGFPQVEILSTSRHKEAFLYL